MANVFSDNSYNPISNAETCYNAPLTNRHIYEQMHNINNLKKYVLNHKTISQIFMPPAPSVASNTSEMLICMFAPRHVPKCFTNFAVHVGHQRFSGTSNCEWSIYSSSALYTKDPVIDTSYLGDYSKVSWNTSSDTHGIHTTPNLEPRRDGWGRTWFLVSAKNYNTLTRANITTLDIYPISAA